MSSLRLHSVALICRLPDKILADFSEPFSNYKLYSSVRIELLNVAVDVTFFKSYTKNASMITHDSSPVRIFGRHYLVPDIRMKNYLWWIEQLSRIFIWLLQHVPIQSGLLSKFIAWFNICSMRINIVIVHRFHSHINLLWPIPLNSQKLNNGTKCIIYHRYHFSTQS